MEEFDDSNAYVTYPIIRLVGLEAVRHRPAMYIGDTGIPGLHHLFIEIIDNCVEEVVAGQCDQILVKLHPDGSLSIYDNGHGIPLDYIKPVLTELHAGGRFGADRTYKTSGGLHGVGTCCVSALSEWLEATVWQAGREVVVRTERGKLVSQRESAFDGPSGTQIRFKPDPQIFETTEWSVQRLLSYLRQQAFLYPKLTVTFTDEALGCDPQVLHFPSGISEWALENVAGRRPVHETVIAGSGSKDGTEAEVAFFFTEDEPVWRIFGNGVELPDAGAPLTGFRQAVSRTLAKWAWARGREFEPRKAGLGVAVVISVRVRNPQFEGPTKNRLSNPEAASAVWAVTAEALEAHLTQYPHQAEAILSGMLGIQGV